MRHSDIKITMDYYANVDDAVMDAVLGSQRNSLRNRGENAEKVNDPEHPKSRWNAASPSSPYLLG